MKKTAGKETRPFVARLVRPALVVAAVLATGASAPLASAAKPLVSVQNTRCAKGPLNNKAWFLVNYRPRNYIGCRVDIVGQVYGSQPLDNAMSFNMHLDPNGDAKYTVFAMDYSDTPPNLKNDTYVRIIGRIEQAAQSVNSITGADQGYVPQVKVAQIIVISQREALRRGLT